ncbi:hypothetical protein DRO61_08665, partial [Candidatus Bathyarchaeota archaeon]
IELLGLKWEQCYGTDDEKNSLTHIKWEDMPSPPNKPHNKRGKMTGREVMQYVGTDIFRNMHQEVWTSATINRIKKDGSKFAVITDCRFPNEVEAVQNAGGKVVRFTRCPFPKDSHSSEIALDEDKFDWLKFDAVIDNKIATISDTNGMFYRTLEDWGWFSGIAMPEESKQKETV